MQVVGFDPHATSVGVFGINLSALVPILGLLDSFAAIQLVLALEETFGLSLDMAVLSRERIATPAAIAALVREGRG